MSANVTERWENFFETHLQNFLLVTSKELKDERARLKQKKIPPLFPPGFSERHHEVIDPMSKLLYCFFRHFQTTSLLSPFSFGFPTDSLSLFFIFWRVGGWVNGSQRCFARRRQEEAMGPGKLSHAGCERDTSREFRRGNLHAVSRGAPILQIIHIIFFVVEIRYVLYVHAYSMSQEKNYHLA